MLTRVLTKTAKVTVTAWPFLIREWPLQVKARIATATSFATGVHATANWSSVHESREILVALTVPPFIVLTVVGTLREGLAFALAFLAFTFPCAFPKTLTFAFTLAESLALAPIVVIITRLVRVRGMRR